MAKRKNNNRKNQAQKRRKVERYWVEDCIELVPPPEIRASVVVTISRVELHDDHIHRPKTDKKKSEEEKQTPTTLTKDAEDPEESTEAQKDPPSETKTEANEQQENPAPQVETEAPDVPIDQAFIAIGRAPSAKGPLKKFLRQNFKPMPNGDCGDGVVNPHDKTEVADKYWAQRKRFFSRFDDGIRLDKEGWYSVTPEVIANHIAKRLVHGRKKGSMVVMDAFCGCGGDSIAFARRPEVSLVIAIDSDRQKLELAASNAAKYEIPPEKLIFIHGNACDALKLYQQDKRMSAENTGESSEKEDPVERDHGFQVGDMGLLPERIDSIFLSPPWGGMDYESSGKRNYHIETCIEVNDSSDVTWNGEEILQACAVATSGPVVYFLPRNVNGISLGRSALKSKYRAIEIEQNLLNNKLKTVTAYLGM